MLKYKNLILRPGLIGNSSFHKRERFVPSKLTWAASCFPVCLAAVDLSGSKRFHSQQIGLKGFGVREVSSQVLQQMEMNTMIVENTDHLNPTYDTAMEALSSLITTKRRGDVPTISNKYTKLERMEMYVKILGLEEPIDQLKIIHVAGTKGKIQSLEIAVDDENFVGMPFVLLSGGNWIKNSSSDFYVEFKTNPAKVQKDAEDGEGTSKFLLDKIADLESEAQKSFMHR